MLSRRARSMSLAAVTSAATIVQWSSCTPAISISQNRSPTPPGYRSFAFDGLCTKRRIGKQASSTSRARALPTEPVTVMQSACGVPPWPDSRGVLGTPYRQRLGILQVVVTLFT
jgi:hypothetical protein